MNDNHTTAEKQSPSAAESAAEALFHATNSLGRLAEENEAQKAEIVKLKAALEAYSGQGIFRLGDLDRLAEALSMPNGSSFAGVYNAAKNLTAELVSTKAALALARTSSHTWQEKGIEAQTRMNEVGGIVTGLKRANEQLARELKRANERAENAEHDVDNMQHEVSELREERDALREKLEEQGAATKAPSFSCDCGPDEECASCVPCDRDLSGNCVVHSGCGTVVQIGKPREALLRFAEAMEKRLRATFDALPAKQQTDAELFVGIGAITKSVEIMTFKYRTGNLRGDELIGYLADLANIAFQFSEKYELNKR